MTRRLVMAAGLALSVGVLPLLAQQGPGRPGPGGPGGPGRGGRGPGGPGGPPGIFAMVHQLDLSDAQREQLKGVMDEGRQDDPGAAMREAEQKLHAALLADTVDLAAVEAAKTAITTAHAAELDHRVEVMQKVAQILTPAQKQQLQKLPPPGPRPGGRGELHH
jgi:Spy/CpxP family protein refolding chaperone